MNQAVEENDFCLGMEKLLAGIRMELEPVTPDPYHGVGNQLVHEHDTRILFFDRFLTLLGWSLGMGGNVREEARIKAETTRFLDYVGVNDQSRSPVLILEAKAWDKPMVRAGTGKPQATERQLIVEAIRHIHANGSRGNSPVIGDWHDYLEQVAGYVRTYKSRYHHDIPCAVLASGQWLVIFKSPVRTFVDGEVTDEQFHIFQGNQILTDAREIFLLLNKSRLASVAPIHIRPAQLRHHLTAANTAAAYHALLVRYESMGATVFAKMPQILVYPALMLQRDDGTIFTVIDRERPNYMNLDRADENGHASLTTHLAAVADEAAQLLQTCSQELGMDLTPFDLSDFPGFAIGTTNTGDEMLPLGRESKAVVRPFGCVADEWIIVTGTQTHYLLPQPEINCRYHAWNECRADGRQIGTSAVGTPSTETPRSFFTDGHFYHCAHTTVDDRRSERCQIAPLDMRTCCRACGLQTVCWSDAEAGQLPCGSKPPAL